MNKLIQWDIDLFLLLNNLHVDCLDNFMTGISGRLIWIPFYLLLLWLLYRKFEVKSVALIVLMVIGLILAVDQTSVHLFKNIFQRLRPCHNELINNSIYLLKACGGKYGFVSSHAANTFAIAVFLGNLLSRKWLFGLLIWAALISYSRIYIGVHYPGDIISGALLGAIIAYLFLQIKNKTGLKIRVDE